MPNRFVISMTNGDVNLDDPLGVGSDAVTAARLAGGHQTDVQYWIIGPPDVAEWVCLIFAHPPNYGLFNPPAAQFPGGPFHLGPQENQFFFKHFLLPSKKRIEVFGFEAGQTDADKRTARFDTRRTATIPAAQFVHPLPPHPRTQARQAGQMNLISKYGNNRAPWAPGNTTIDLSAIPPSSVAERFVDAIMASVAVAPWISHAAGAFADWDWGHADVRGAPNNPPAFNINFLAPCVRRTGRPGGDGTAMVEAAAAPHLHVAIRRLTGVAGGVGGIYDVMH